MDAVIVHSHTRAQRLTFHWYRPEQWATGLFTANGFALTLCFSFIFFPLLTTAAKSGSYPLYTV